MDLSDVVVRLRSFAAERDWERFHDPKNLAMALAAESLQCWMLTLPGVVLTALSARILLAAPPRLLWRRTSAGSG